MSTQGLRNTKRNKPKSKVDSADLFLPPYLKGSLLTFALLITVLGAIIVVPPALSEWVKSQWLWTDTRAILVLLISIAILSLFALFHQQGFVISSHERYEKSRAEVLDRAQRNANRLYALLDVSSMMGTSASPRDLFDYITATCGKVFDCDMASLMLFDRSSNELVVRSVGGPKARKEALGDRKPLGEGIAGWAAERQQSLLLHKNCDTSQYPGLTLGSKKVNAAMVIPIVLGGQLMGVLNVSTQSPTVDYDDEDFKAAEVFAANAGTCIRYTKQLMRAKLAGAKPAENSSGNPGGQSAPDTVPS